jgi:hypothetical protein
MTVTIDGVRLKVRRKNRHWMSLALILTAEGILSAFVYMSLAAHIIWPAQSRAAAGVASVLSYQGRLMDTSGNPLGGTGEPYCFRFSIYDAETAGTKLWPAGTPATTMATTTDGVFNALIGQADALTYNFYDSDTVYLNVEVNTTATTCAGSWETLSPRQRIASTGYSQSAENVYSSLLFTDNTNNRVQIGTGTGGASPKFLGLDVKNVTGDYIGQSCTTSGTVWYNSAISKALVCENGTIQAISNSSATTTLAAITANTGTPATTGTIVFSNSNGVTFGINGNTITASVAAGGGATLSAYNGGAISFPLVAGQQGQGTLHVRPFVVDDAVQYDRIAMPLNYTQASNSTLTASVSMWVGIYTQNASTLSLVGSTSISASVNGSGTASSSVFLGPRIFTIGSTTTLSPGNYWIGILSRTSTSSNNASISQYLISQVNSNYSGLWGVSTNTTQQVALGWGTYSATTSAMPNSIGFTQIRGAGASLVLRAPAFYFTSGTI